MSDDDREVQRRAVDRARTTDGAAIAAGLWRSFVDPAYDLRDRAAEVTCPTLLVWGDKDPIVPLRAGRATLKALPHARLERFATGHVVFSSDPTGVLACLLPFLDEVTTGAGAGAGAGVDPGGAPATGDADG